jgi:hypothetical protein
VVIDPVRSSLSIRAVKHHELFSFSSSRLSVAPTGNSVRAARAAAARATCIRHEIRSLAQRQIVYCGLKHMYMCGRCEVCIVAARLLNSLCDATHKLTSDGDSISLSAKSSLVLPKGVEIDVRSVGAKSPNHMS